MIESVATTASPTASPTSASAAKHPGVLGKDEFLKMLVAQLRHQDPLNPMDGQQMAAQMAQFSSVEQLINLNAAMSAQQAGQAALVGATQTASAIGTIGREVLAFGQDLIVDGGESRDITIDVGAAGGSATLTIYDETGRRVGGRDLGDVDAGSNTISLDSAVDGLADGRYRYDVTVKDATGNAVGVSHYMRGTVDGVRSTAEGLMLTAGGLTIPYASVVQIYR